MMRLSKAIALLLRKFDPASPDKTSSTLLTPSILILLTQVLLRLLSDQNTDGSWGRGHFPEETAYALLALKSISPLSWTELFGGKIQDSIAMATTFLESKADQWHEANYLWTEKVTYKSSLLSQAYCIAALKTTYSIATRVSNYNPNPVQTTQILELATFLKSLPQFADQESWNLLLSVVEGCFLFSKFQATHIDIFPFEAIYNRYMMYIPITLVAVNNLRKHGSRLSNEQLWDMIISFSLSYEIEFYIQKQASTLASTEILELQDFVSAVLSSHRSKQPSFKRQKIEPSNSSNGFDTSIRTNGIHQSNQCDGIYDGNQSDKTNKRKATDSTIEAVQSKLAAYVSHITQHSSILSSPARVQARQRQDLKAFLLAHLQSAADQQGPNIQRSNSNPNASLVREPLFSWLHESAAIKTGIPHTFTFLTVITTPENIILFSTPTSQYYADVLRTHLAAAYRLRDDYDNIETYMMGGKLSSLHWLKETKDTKEYCDKVKSMISDLAAFEDQTWQAALLKLEDELGVGKLMGMRIYLDFVNIFGRVCSSRILDGAAQDDV